MLTMLYSPYQYLFHTDGLEVRERVRFILELEVFVAVTDGMIEAGKAGSLAVGQVRLWLL